ncbi:MAG: hypothetical protein ABSD29_10025 [Verrucomicrobiota bacterium]
MKRHRTILRRLGLLAATATTICASALAPQSAHATNPIFIDPTTCGTPNGTAYLGDTLGSPWYVWFEIGQASWNNAQAGIGTSSAGTGYTWYTAYWDHDDGGNKVVKADIGATKFTSTGSWYVICQANESSGETYTSESGCGWGNPITYPPANLTSSYFTVNALVAPSGQTATAASSSEIDLTWTQGVSGSSTKNTVILRSTGSAPNTDPTQGTAYSQGATIGNATVVYPTSNGTSFRDTTVSAGTKYYYKFYAENYSYYSAGVTANACTTPSITGQPASTNVCQGSTASFTVAATAASPTCQWQYNSGSTWASVTDGTGQTSSTYTTPTLSDTSRSGYKYRCQVTDACGTVLTSDGNATLTVNATSVGGTAAPAASPVCTGSAPTINLSGNTGNVTKWQSSPDQSTWTDIANTTTTLNNAPAITATTYYRAVVTSGVCSSANSSAATVTVNAVPGAPSPNVSYNLVLPFSLKISISDLLTNWTGSSLSVQSAGPNSTDSGTVTKDSTYIYYLPPAGSPTSPDTIPYTVSGADGCTTVAYINVVFVSAAGGQAQAITVVGGTATVNFAGIPGYPYIVQRAEDVSFTVNLTTVLTTNAPDDGVFTCVDTSPPGSQAYYRLMYNP